MGLLLLRSLKEFDPVKYRILKFGRNGDRDFGGRNGGGEVEALLKVTVVITLSRILCIMLYFQG